MAELAKAPFGPRPKVCILTETYYPVIGGGETQARLLAGGLASAGFSVIVMTRRSDAALAKVEQVGPATVYRLPPVGRGQLKKWGLMFSALPKLIQLRRQYDLIFVSGFRIVGITAVLASKLLGKACVLKADSQGEMSGEFFRAGLAKLQMKPESLPFRLFLRLRNRILRKADAYVAITSDMVTEFASAGLRRDKIQLIANSVDTTRFAPVPRQQKLELRQKLHIPSDHTVVIYTGRLVSYKGLPLLLEVWRHLQEQRSHNTLLLAGSGGLDIHNCEAELQEYVATHHLQDTVRFTGGVENVHEYLQASDIFVFPTLDDAFPSSVVEAMSCGLPVIATPVGAIGEIVRDGQNGLLIQPGDGDGLLQALDTLLGDSELARQLGQRARITAHDCYSSTAVNESYGALFRSFIKPGIVV
jgi:glycosyltransferase involved in cell wall biosynthesis